MKAAELPEAIKRHDEFCVVIGQNLSLAELRVMAQTVFPVGTLPDESNLIELTTVICSGKRPKPRDDG
jgi:hypothetical protein